MDVPLVAGCAAAGLLLGDQLEVVVQRTGAHQSLTRPWWRCDSCHKPLTGLARVPLVRAAGNRRCGSCGATTAHRWRPTVLAVVSAVVLGALAGRFGPDAALAPFAVWGLGLVALSAVDVERYIIPNRVVYPTLAVVGPLLVAASAVDDRWGSLAWAAIAGAVAFAAMFAVHFAYPKGMGFGDVRLSGLVGVAAGWLGLGHAFVAFLAGFVLASVVGVAAGMVSGQGRKQRLFFGPFLAAGGLIAVVAGNPMVAALFHRGG
jgi:leader peptidase (prepilin peptidase)/N-methyltransferase